MDARHDLVALARLDDALLGLDDGCVGLVEPRLAAERQAQVRGTHVDRVDAGHAQDLVQVLERGRRLDHRHDDEVGVGVIGVVGAGVDRRPDGAEAPVPARRILARLDERLRLLAGVDHRADDAVDAGVERLHQERGVVPRHAGQRHHRRRGDGLEHRHRGLVVDDPVLHVDGERIEALVGHDLGGEGAGNGEPAVDDCVSAGPDGLERVLSHVGSFTGGWRELPAPRRTRRRA